MLTGGQVLIGGQDRAGTGRGTGQVLIGGRDRTGMGTGFDRGTGQGRY